MDTEDVFWRHLVAANYESGPEEKLPRNLERFTFTQAPANCCFEGVFEILDALIRVKGGSKFAMR